MQPGCHENPSAHKPLEGHAIEDFVLLHGHVSAGDSFKLQLLLRCREFAGR